MLRPPSPKGECRAGSEFSRIYVRESRVSSELLKILVRESRREPQVLCWERCGKIKRFFAFIHIFLKNFKRLMQKH
jgi:hypothetical protein